MSETEHLIGKLTPVKMQGTVEETCKAILAEMGAGGELDYYDSYAEKLGDISDHYITRDCVYDIQYEEVEDGDIFNAHKNEDGTISFEVQYYNGGCCLSEALDYAMRKLK